MVKIKNNKVLSVILSEDMYTTTKIAFRIKVEILQTAYFINLTKKKYLVNFFKSCLSHKFFYIDCNF